MALYVSFVFVFQEARSGRDVDFIFYLRPIVDIFTSGVGLTGCLREE